MKKEFTCIVCPNGCTISAEYDIISEIHTEGALCKRGEAYVRQELTDPRRTIASSVLVAGGVSDLVSVRLTAPIPLGSIREAMEQIRACRVQAPVRTGDVLISHILGTDSDVIATRTVERRADE